MKGKYDMRKNDLMIIENCLESKEDKLDAGDEPFEKLMFFYESALNQLETQMNIIKREFKIMYNYDLIDHVTSRIKEPKSIIKKMDKKRDFVFAKLRLKTRLYVLFFITTIQFHQLGLNDH